MVARGWPFSTITSCAELAVPQIIATTAMDKRICFMDFSWGRGEPPSLSQNSFSDHQIYLDTSSKRRTRQNRTIAEIASGVLRQSPPARPKHGNQPAQPAGAPYQ